MGSKHRVERRNGAAPFDVRGVKGPKDLKLLGDTRIKRSSGVRGSRVGGSNRKINRFSTCMSECHSIFQGRIRTRSVSSLDSDMKEGQLSSFAI